MVQSFVSADAIRTLFSRTMSRMYRTEVPQYGTLLELVATVNAETLTNDHSLAERLNRTGELERLDVERHGAIRLGTAEELFNIRRIFGVMGMQPVGYYDLAVAGVPVHATAFRPVDDFSLRHNPFRMFTSLLRLELIEDDALRAEAAAILERRQIITDRALALATIAEQQGGLTPTQAEEFVAEALETFRWHNAATIGVETYRKLHDAHRLIADVVSFKGPHINHLTPRTLDIDAAQAAMPGRGITAKAYVEGPPHRNCPILLRQTSFTALEEAISFPDGQGGMIVGTHTARFGEIEQRGVALTQKGRQLYDTLLTQTQQEAKARSIMNDGKAYAALLAERFQLFPDDWDALRANGLAFFRYTATDAGKAAQIVDGERENLLAAGYLHADPIVYEDFLPVSAAGIFQSNLGTAENTAYTSCANKAAFEQALGCAVQDEIALYQQTEATSLQLALQALGLS